MSHESSSAPLAQMFRVYEKSSFTRIGPMRLTGSSIVLQVLDIMIAEPQLEQLDLGTEEPKAKPKPSSAF